MAGVGTARLERGIERENMIRVGDYPNVNRGERITIGYCCGRECD